MIYHDYYRISHDYHMIIIMTTTDCHMATLPISLLTLLSRLAMYSETQVAKEIVVELNNLHEDRTKLHERLQSSSSHVALV